MNWSALRIFAGSEEGQVGRAEPLSDVNVTFVLMNEDASIQFETSVVSDSEGYATLQNTSNVMYTKINLNYDYDDEETKNQSRTYVNSSDIDFLSVTQWYASFQGTRGTCYSNTYQLQNSPSHQENGEIIDRGSTSTNSHISSCIVEVIVGNIAVYDAQVYCFGFNSNNVLREVLSGTTNSGGITFQFTDSSIEKVKINAYIEFNGTKYAHFDSSFRTSVIPLSIPTFQVTATSFTTLTAYTSNIYYHDLALSNLTHEKVGVSLWRLSIKNEDWTTIEDDIPVVPSALTNVIGITATTPTVLYCGRPDTSSPNSSKFYSGYTSINLLGYPTYGNTECPHAKSIPIAALRKRFIIENSVTVDTLSDYDGTPVFRLPNVNLTYKLSYNNSLITTFTGTSNQSATTFNLEGTSYGKIFTNALTKTDENYKPDEKYQLIIVLTKEHYKEQTIALYASASYISFVTGNHLNEPFFYYCKVNNEKLNYKPQKYQFIQREPDYCMKGSVFSHYVQGFDYSYEGDIISATTTAETNGDRSISDEIGEETTPPTIERPGLRDFNLPSRKVITATYDFFSACCYNTNPKLDYFNFNTTLKFKENFVDFIISEHPYDTQYASSTEKHSTENGKFKGHAYSTRNECFLPIKGNEPPYLEFYLKEDSESKGMFRLVKIGNPTNHSLEYSYWNNEWVLYQWEETQIHDGNQITLGEVISIIPGANVRFRNRNNVENFSKDKSNFYHFSFLDSNICVKNNISSLINVNADGKKAGNYCFYNLFSIYPINLPSIFPFNKGLYSMGSNNENRLILDPTNIGIGCYDHFSNGNTYLYHGAVKLEAITGNDMCFAYMFYGCNNMVNGPISISLNSYPSGCCASMFEDCNALTNAPVLNDTTSISIFNNMCFNSMFLNCYDLKFSNSDYNLGKLNDLTIGDKACEKMFYNCTSITKTAKFQPILISYSGCSEMFYNCKSITGNKFSMTGGTVRNYGCYNMFYNNKFSHASEDSSKAINPINATELGVACYYGMFYCCDNLNGYIYKLPATTIPTSAYSFMFSSAGNLTERNLSVGSDFINATSLAPYCYANMFSFSGLKKVPKLPATTLYEGCYSHMFEYANLEEGFHDGEVSINKKTRGHLGDKTSSVVLKATSLPKKCYEYMFSHSGIKRILDVITTGLTTVGEQSCSHMFESTPIKFDPYFRFLCLDGEEGRVLTRKNLDMYTFLNSEYEHSWTFGDRDSVRNVMTDFIYNGGNNIKILTGITVSSYGTTSSKYFVVGYYTNGGQKYTTQAEWHEHWQEDVTNDYLLSCTDTGIYYSYFTKYATFHEDETGNTQPNDAYCAYIHGIDRVYCAITYTQGPITSSTPTIPTDVFMDTLEYPGMSEPVVTATTETPPSLPYGPTYYTYYWIQTGHVYSDVNCGWCESHRIDNNTHWSSFKKIDEDNRNFRNYKVKDFFKEYSYDEQKVGDNLSAARGTDRHYLYEYKTKRFYVDLNATTLGKNCYEYMFANCHNIYAGHYFRFGNLKNTSEGCFNHMFEGCINLRSIQPSITGLTLSKNCFEGMYSHCGKDNDDKTGLEICADYWKAYNIQNCSTGNLLNFPPDGMIHKPKTDIQDGYSDVYGICLNPEWNDRMAVVFNKSLYEECFKNMFSECINIRYPKIELNQTTLAKSCYEGMFCGCTQMVSGLSLTVYTGGTAKDSCFKNMFKYCLAYVGDDTCTKLHENLEESCYESMFSHCMSMSAAPYLPATTLSTNSYKQMFFNAISTEFTAQVICNFTGTAIVNGTGTYTDSFKITYHQWNDKSYFTYERGSDCTPRVKPDVHGYTGNISSWRTFYTNESIVTSVFPHPSIPDDSMNDNDFFKDVHERFYKMITSDSEIGSFFENTEYGEIVLPSYFPKCLELQEHLSRIETVMQNFMNEYYANNTRHREWFDITREPVVVEITNHTTGITTGYGSNPNGIKYIKADLNSSEAEANKTYQWVKGLDGFGNTGHFYRTSNGPTTYGENSIPNGWAIN